MTKKIEKDEVLELLTPDVKIKVEAILDQLVEKAEMAEYGLKKRRTYYFEGVCRIVVETRYFFYHNERYFVKTGSIYRSIKKTIIERYYDQICQLARKNKMYEFGYSDANAKKLIKFVERRCVTTNKHIDPACDWVPFTNGYFNLETEEFVESLPNMYFTRSCSVEYIKGGDCPQFKKFIKEILPDEKDRLKVLSFMAYGMSCRIDLQTQQIWTGDGNNGKSTLADLYQKIMSKLASGQPLKKIMDDKNRFSKGMIRKKRINIGSEVGIKKIKDGESAELKEFFTKSSKDGEEKNNKDLLEWENITKHIFDMNNLPTVSAYMDYAFFRRWDIIVFPRRFTPEEVDTGLLKRLYEEEAPQIAQYILSFYKGCDKIIRDFDGHITREKWIRYSHTVFAFLELHETIGEHSRFNDVYDMYCEWCREIGRPSEEVGKNKFSTLLSSARKKPYRRNDIEGNTYFVPFECTYRDTQKTLEKYKCRIYLGEMMYDWGEDASFGYELPSPVLANITGLKLPSYVVRVVVMQNGEFAYFKAREMFLDITDLSEIVT